MNEKSDFHIDMSGRIFDNRTIGIAMVGTKTKIHHGCALRGNMIKLIKKELFKENIFKDYAKLYAICIFLLVNKVKNNVKSLIVCNDEDFKIVKEVLLGLLGEIDFEIINITEFKKRLGRNIGSLADNYARVYRKRALKPNKWLKGKKLNIINLNYSLIKKYWGKIKAVSD